MKRLRPRAATRAVAVCTVFALLTGATAPAREDVGTVLHGVATWPEVPERVSELVALGSPAIPELFGALCEERYSFRTPDGAETEAPLGPQQRAAARLALRQLPMADVREFFDGWGRSGTDPLHRECAVTLLGRLGNGTDLDRLERLARPAEEGARADRSARLAFAEAVARILKRDATAVRTVDDLFSRAHPSFLAALARAVGGLDDEEALGHLAALLGHVPDADAVVLREIDRLCGRLRRPIKSDATSRVRDLLQDADAAKVRMAITVVRKTEDHEAVARLIALLQHADENVRSASHGALQDLTGLPLAPDPSLWSAWYEKEAAWWRERSAPCGEQIVSGGLEEAVAAIDEAARVRLNHHNLARLLLPGLQRRDPGAVRTACIALGNAGSEAALPALVDTLAHRDAAVREAAARALQRITGQVLPPDRDAWLRRLRLDTDP